MRLVITRCAKENEGEEAAADEEGCCCLVM